MAPAAILDQTDATTGTLFYVHPPADGSKPFVNVNASAESGARDTNLKVNPVNVKINNIRTATNPIGLDVTGFDLRTVPSEFSQNHENFLSESKIEQEYYPEIRDALLKATGAKEIFIFDHTIRRRTPGTLDDDPSKRQPVARVHVDQTTSAAFNRVKRHLGDRADELVKNRFQLINVWRPIQHTASDHPLAVGAFKSLNRNKDLLPTTLVYPDPLPNGETYSVAHSPSHEWYYVKDMTIDEIMFIKCFDTEGLKEDSGIALLTPHTAFEDPNTPADSPARQSIEVRCLVFY
ncbi:hypothetical protein H072_2138 [Dactylellina haptotyla CBS 200.50]|uniref:Methyltransferase n=1 Tax=Dactylellina haptotyla (strain CBS 200.50) TaxID=1284197 RepID=S8AM39_DACHA|nr:hypothetical protein H072_2138 [Dactylellina haptotyla CBS 200.50]